MWPNICRIVFQLVNKPFCFALEKNTQHICYYLREHTQIYLAWCQGRITLNGFFHSCLYNHWDFAWFWQSMVMEVTLWQIVHSIFCNACEPSFMVFLVVSGVYIHHINWTLSTWRQLWHGMSRTFFGFFWARKGAVGGVTLEHTLTCCIANVHILLLPSTTTSRTVSL